MEIKECYANEPQYLKRVSKFLQAVSSSSSLLWVTFINFDLIFCHVNKLELLNLKQQALIIEFYIVEQKDVKIDEVSFFDITWKQINHLFIETIFKHKQEGIFVIA